MQQSDVDEQTDAEELDKLVASIDKKLSLGAKVRFVCDEIKRRQPRAADVIPCIRVPLFDLDVKVVHTSESPLRATDPRDELFVVGTVHGECPLVVLRHGAELSYSVFNVRDLDWSQPCVFLELPEKDARIVSVASASHADAIAVCTDTALFVVELLTQEILWHVDDVSFVDCALNAFASRIAVVTADRTGVLVSYVLQNGLAQPEFRRVDEHYVDAEKDRVEQVYAPHFISSEQLAFVDHLGDLIVVNVEHRQIVTAALTLPDDELLTRRMLFEGKAPVLELHEPVLFIAGTTCSDLVIGRAHHLYALGGCSQFIADTGLAVAGASNEKAFFVLRTTGEVVGTDAEGNRRFTAGPATQPDTMQARYEVLCDCQGCKPRTTWPHTVSRPVVSVDADMRRLVVCDQWAMVRVFAK